MAINEPIYPSPPSRAPALPNLAGICVLLIDDDLDQLTMLSELLSHASADVVSATSADGALQEIARRLPDVIVSDISMPDCDGYQLLRRLRTRPVQEGGSTPAIALTGRVTQNDQTRALLAGYQTYLAKPVRIIDLVVAIRSVIDATLTS
jgi:CheY-like chemotaxis protein